MSLSTQQEEIGWQIEVRLYHVYRLVVLQLATATTTLATYTIDILRTQLVYIIYDLTDKLTLCDQILPNLASIHTTRNGKLVQPTIIFRPEPVLLLKMPIMLLSIAPNISPIMFQLIFNAFGLLLCPKYCYHNWRRPNSFRIGRSGFCRSYYPTLLKP